jgi:hypothetical protein
MNQTKPNESGTTKLNLDVSYWTMETDEAILVLLSVDRRTDMTKLASNYLIFLRNAQTLNTANNINQNKLIHQGITDIIRTQDRTRI